MSVVPARDPMRRFGPTALVTPANLVTAGRLLLGIPFLAFVAVEGASWAAVAGWIVLSISDWYDGYLARKDGTTRSGAYLDPLADKVITVGGFVALAVEGVYHAVPVALIAGREAVVSAHRTVMGRRGISVPARALGKNKTVVQLVTVGFALLPLTADAGWLIQGTLWFAVALTLVSGLDILRFGVREGPDGADEAGPAGEVEHPDGGEREEGPR